MVETSINLFDLIVLVVVGLSALLSFFRGFIREVLSLGAWVGASIITMYTFPSIADLIKPYVNNDKIASGLAVLVGFLIALILISIVTSILLKFLKKGSEVGMTDNLMGLIFGVARAWLLLSLGYFIMNLVIAEKNHPEWIATAISKPYIASGAGFIEKIAPDYLATIENSTKGTDLDVSKELKTLKELKKQRDKSEKGNSSNLPDVIKGGKATNNSGGDSLISLEDLEKIIDSDGIGKIIDRETKGQ